MYRHAAKLAAHPNSPPAIPQFFLPTADYELRLHDVLLIWVIRVECLSGADALTVFPL